MTLLGISGQVSFAARSRLFGQMRRMLHHGLTLRQTAATMAKSAEKLPLRKFAEGLESQLEAGSSLVEALRNDRSGIATPLEVSLTTAGEKGGQIETALKALEDHYNLCDRTETRLRQGLFIPLLTLHIATIVSGIVAHAGDSGWMIMGSILLRLLILWIILVGLLQSAAWLWRKAAKNDRLDAWLNAIPLLGPMRRNMALSRFCTVCALGFKSGLRISDTLGLAGAAAQSPELELGGNFAAENVKAGLGLANSLAATARFPWEIVAAARVAETSGDLDGEMHRQARNSAHAAENEAQRFASRFPAIIYALVALWAIYIIFSFYAASFSQLTSVD